MSRTLNKVMLIGNVGREPELKFTPSGIPVASFRLATSETWKDRNGNLQEHTDWHTVVAWRGLAEVCQKLLRKGARIYIEGKLQTRSIEDKNNFKKQLVEVVAENMIILDNKQRNKESGEHYGETSDDSLYSTSVFDDSIFDNLDDSLTDPFEEFDSFTKKDTSEDIPF